MVLFAWRCIVGCLQAPRQVLCQWGLVLVVQSDGTVLTLKEKELTSKLELLYNKSLYLLALNLAQSDQAHLNLFVSLSILEAKLYMPAQTMHALLCWQTLRLWPDLLSARASGSETLL